MKHGLISNLRDWTPRIGTVEGMYLLQEYLKAERWRDRSMDETSRRWDDEHSSENRCAKSMNISPFPDALRNKSMEDTSNISVHFFWGVSSPDAPWCWNLPTQLAHFWCKSRSIFQHRCLAATLPGGLQDDVLPRCQRHGQPSAANVGAPGARGDSHHDGHLGSAAVRMASQRIPKKVTDLDVHDHVCFTWSNLL